MEESPPPQDETDAEAARGRLLTAVVDAVDAAARIADPDRAYAAAKLLAEDLHRALVMAGQLHARSAARIYDQHRVTFTVLATRLGISRSRAEQLVRAARKTTGRDAT